jgi:uncharacterized protein (TIGR02246 family)
MCTEGKMKIRVVALLTALLAVVSIAAIAQAVAQADAKAEIHRLAKALDAAALAHDAQALGKIFDDEGQFISGDGRIFDKQAYVADYTDPKRTFETVKSDIASVRVLGDTAIEIGTWNASGKLGGEAFRWRVRYMSVWLKKGGKWVITAEQATGMAREK